MGGFPRYEHGLGEIRSIRHVPNRSDFRCQGCGCAASARRGRSRKRTNRWRHADTGQVRSTAEHRWRARAFDMRHFARRYRYRGFCSLRGRLFLLQEGRLISVIVRRLNDLANPRSVSRLQQIIEKGFGIAQIRGAKALGKRIVNWRQ